MMYPRALKLPKGTSFLFGMRGVGKSTWALDQKGVAKHLSLLHEATYQAFLANPALFRLELESLASGSLVIVDEVQRLPNLLNEVHALIEERRLRFLLLGSSARKLRRAGVNLLGGRAIPRAMFPLLPSEAGADYQVNEVLRFGALPLIWNSDDKPEQLRAYAEAYLKEEIQAEALVRNLPGFARFLPIAALMHAQVLSVESIARDAGVQRNTVTGFLDVLEDTLLITRLPAHEGRLRVKQRKHPKLYWHDPGVVRAVLRRSHVPTAEERGPLFEGLVYQWLLAYREYRLFDYDALTYWAVHGSKSAEVDFLVERGDQCVALEVKSTTKVHDPDLGGLRALAEVKRCARSIVVYLGDRVLRTSDGIDIWPWQKLVEYFERGGDG